MAKKKNHSSQIFAFVILVASVIMGFLIILKGRGLTSTFYSAPKAAPVCEAVCKSSCPTGYFADPAYACPYTDAYSNKCCMPIESPTPRPPSPTPKPPSPTPTITPTPFPTPSSCSTGQYRCSPTRADALEVCVERFWYFAETCSYGCNITSCHTSTSCFLKGTKIATPHGDKNIEDLTSNDKVISFTDSIEPQVSSSTVSKVFKSKRDSYYQLTAGSYTVDVTAEHPIYIGGGQYKEAGQLKTGDVVYLLLDGKLVSAPVEYISKVNQATDVYNLTVKEDHTFFANNFAVHNKPLLDGVPVPTAAPMTGCNSGTTSGYSYLCNGPACTNTSKGITYCTDANSACKTRNINAYAVAYGGSCGADKNIGNVTFGRRCLSSFGGVCFSYSASASTATCCLPATTYNSQQQLLCGKGTVSATFQSGFTQSRDFPYSCQTSGAKSCITNHNWNLVLNDMQAFHPDANDLITSSSIPQGDAKSCSLVTGTNSSGGPVLTNGYCCP